MRFTRILGKLSFCSMPFWQEPPHKALRRAWTSASSPSGHSTTPSISKTRFSDRCGAGSLRPTPALGRTAHPRPVTGMRLRSLPSRFRPVCWRYRGSACRKSPTSRIGPPISPPRLSTLSPARPGRGRPGCSPSAPAAEAALVHFKNANANALHLCLRAPGQRAHYTRWHRQLERPHSPSQRFLARCMASRGHRQGITPDRRTRFQFLFLELQKPER